MSGKNKKPEKRPKTKPPLSEAERKKIKESWRKLLFFIAILLFCLWMFIHYREAGWYVLLAGGVVIASTIYAIWAEYGKNDGQQKNLKTRIRSLITTASNPLVIVIMYTILIVAMGFVTTVQVDAEGLPEAVNVSIMTETDTLARARKCSPGKSTVITLWTTPWGRSVTVQPAGFSGRDYRIYPLFFRGLNIKDEFQPRLSVLFLMMEAPNLLADGKFVFTYGDHLIDCVKVKADRPFNALMIGVQTSIAQEKKSEWDALLNRQDIKGELYTEIVKGWENPFYKEGRTLHVADTIRAMFVWRNGNYAAERKIALINDNLQNCLLE